MKTLIFIKKNGTSIMGAEGSACSWLSACHTVNPISFSVMAGKDGMGLSLVEQNWVGC